MGFIDVLYKLKNNFKMININKIFFKFFLEFFVDNLDSVVNCS